MSTVALLAITGSDSARFLLLDRRGLSLIWGLMRVLNLAHGAFFTVAAYAAGS